MCRNIRTLYNYEPPATIEEARAAALQYVRKISGFQKPSKMNEDAFDKAVEDITDLTIALIGNLETKAPPRSREIEIEKARARNRLRFGQ